MPSRATELAALAVMCGLLALLYAASIAHRPLLGLGTTVACLVVAALLYAGDTNRDTVAGVAMVVTVVYGVFTLQLPAAMVGACVISLTPWVTDADGSFDATPPAIFPDRVFDDGDDEAAE
jgi:hypothetical protein